MRRNPVPVVLVAIALLGALRFARNPATNVRAATPMVAAQHPIVGS